MPGEQTSGRFPPMALFTAVFIGLLGGSVAELQPVAQVTVQIYSPALLSVPGNCFTLSQLWGPFYNGRAQNVQCYDNLKYSIVFNADFMDASSLFYFYYSIANFDMWSSVFSQLNLGCGVSARYLDTYASLPEYTVCGTASNVGSCLFYLPQYFCSPPPGPPPKPPSPPPLPPPPPPTPPSPPPAPPSPPPTCGFRVTVTKPGTLFSADDCGTLANLVYWGYCEGLTLIQNPVCSYSTLGSMSVTGMVADPPASSTFFMKFVLRFDAAKLIAKRFQLYCTDSYAATGSAICGAQPSIWNGTNLPDDMPCQSPPPSPPAPPPAPPGPPSPPPSPPFPPPSPPAPPPSPPSPPAPPPPPPPALIVLTILYPRAASIVDCNALVPAFRLAFSSLEVKPTTVCTWVENVLNYQFSVPQSKGQLTAQQVSFTVTNINRLVDLPCGTTLSLVSPPPTGPVFVTCLNNPALCCPAGARSPWPPSPPPFPPPPPSPSPPPTPPTPPPNSPPLPPPPQPPSPPPPSPPPNPPPFPPPSPPAPSPPWPAIPPGPPSLLGTQIAVISDKTLPAGNLGQQLCASLQSAFMGTCASAGLKTTPPSPDCQPAGPCLSLAPLVFYRLPVYFANPSAYLAFASSVLTPLQINVFVGLAGIPCGTTVIMQNDFGLNLFQWTPSNQPQALDPNVASSRCIRF